MNNTFVRATLGFLPSNSVFLLLLSQGGEGLVPQGGRTPSFGDASPRGGEHRRALWGSYSGGRGDIRGKATNHRLNVNRIYGHLCCEPQHNFATPCLSKILDRNCKVRVKHMLVLFLSLITMCTTAMIENIDSCVQKA